MKTLVPSAALVAATLALTGCVERILRVRTDPPRSAIYVNGDSVGATSDDGVLAHPFTYYGTVDVTARAPGHYSRREYIALEPPWYQIFPLDFVSEVLIPWNIEDVHELDLTLAPSPPEMDSALQKELRAKAEALRAANAAAPAQAVPPPAAPAPAPEPAEKEKAPTPPTPVPDGEARG
jgi:hypothetical protein